MLWGTLFEPGTESELEQRLTFDVFMTALVSSQVVSFKLNPIDEAPAVIRDIFAVRFHCLGLLGYLGEISQF